MKICSLKLSVQYINYRVRYKLYSLLIVKSMRPTIQIVLSGSKNVYILLPDLDIGVVVVVLVYVVVS